MSQYECSGCNYHFAEPMALREVTRRSDGGTFWLCPLCASTYIGQAMEIGQPNTDHRVLQTICYTGNVVLAAINEAAKRLPPPEVYRAPPSAPAPDYEALIGLNLCDVHSIDTDRECALQTIIRVVSKVMELFQYECAGYAAQRVQCALEALFATSVLRPYIRAVHSVSHDRGFITADVTLTWEEPSEVKRFVTTVELKR